MIIMKLITQYKLQARTCSIEGGGGAFFFFEADINLKLILKN